MNKFELVAKKWLSGNIETHTFTHRELNKALLFAYNFCDNRAMDLIAVGPAENNLNNYFKNK